MCKFFYVTFQRNEMVSARIRACAATYHDLSSAIPHKKRDRDKEGKNRRLNLRIQKTKEKRTRL